VRRGIEDAGFTECTPIQASTLPLGLAGQDVAGQAQTGTGKTAAFLIATFTRLLRNEAPVNERGKAPRAIMIAPTRELAVQIYEEAEMLGKYCGLTMHAVYGGVDYVKQLDRLKEGVDILIGTPGRLIDYFRQRAYRLDTTEVLVIDEADRMFDMGFIDDIRFLLRHLPKPDVRQSFLYSATLSHRVLELAYEHMNRVERVAVSEEQITAENITQLVYHVGMHEKLSVLLGLLEREKPTRALVFVNMRSTAARIAERLEAQGHSAGALAGDMDQRKRLKLLSRLKDGSLKILVATDVASRGLHIDNVSHVFNYDLPQDPEDYVHRIGRTARAGLSGKAYSLACEKYVYSLEAIEDYLGAKLPHEFPDESLPVTPVRFRPKRKPQDDDRGGRRTSGRRSDGNRGRSSESGSPRTGSGEGGDKQPASTGGEKAAAPGDGEAVKKKGRRRRKKKPTDSGTSVPAE
jgi:ATP-dependent RNA helicase RhlB